MVYLMFVVRSEDFRIILLFSIYNEYWNITFLEHTLK